MVKPLQGRRLRVDEESSQDADKVGEIVSLGVGRHGRNIHVRIYIDKLLFVAMLCYALLCDVMLCSAMHV